MALSNAEIARMLNEIADLLEIEGANPYRVRAYRNAAFGLEGLRQSVADLVERGEDLTELPGIGEALAEKLTEVVRTGRIHQLDELRQRIPAQLIDLYRVPGLGPKRVQTLYQKLGITSLPELEQAARAGKVRELPGMGEKIEQDIIRQIEQIGPGSERIRRIVAEQIAEPLAAYLREGEGIEDVAIAGSYRRGVETVGDLDILVISEEGRRAAERLVAYEFVGEVVSQGDTRSTVKLRSGVQVDMRVVPRRSYGAALSYFTGSKAHGLALRQMAIRHGLKLNEYGIFRGDEQIAGETEEELYATLGLPYIVPELREDRGEIEAAREGRLPHLVTVEDLRGDLQSHTTASDGRSSLEEMVQAARARGYRYLAVTDHSKYIAVTNGLDADRLARQIDEIDRLNEELEPSGFRLLKSCEVDIRDDGTLALPNDILSRLDLTVCSVHSRFGLSAEEQTERIIRAMDNPYFNILAHPTGRRIGERRPYDIDMERLMTAALERGCYMEINAQPERLDLHDVHCKMAKEMGLKLAISTDAHHESNLDYARLGVMQARRGWLEADGVLNTRDVDDLLRLLKR
ncbi:MAG: DNA polymerase/3'-5' exonuclease PolX [Anaerolineae bacterium]|jgi:DNA polymerase (family 10)